MREFNFKSPNSISQNYEALTKKGYLTRNANGYSFFPETKKKSLYLSVDGIITAGVLRELDIDDELPPVTLNTLLGYNNQDVMVLLVDGDSMTNFGILPGDYVFLKKNVSIGSAEYENGFIGAINYRGTTTLKKIYKEPSRMRLEAGNEYYADIYIEPGDFEKVEIIGQYIGHIHINR